MKRWSPCILVGFVLAVAVVAMFISQVFLKRPRDRDGDRTQDRTWAIPDVWGNYKDTTGQQGGQWRGGEDPPTTTVPYIDVGRGIAFEVPYNKLWGNELWQLPPYEVVQDGLRFGPVLGYCEGGGVCRTMYFRVVPKRSATQIVKENTFEELGVYPELQVINGIEVVHLVEATTGVSMFYAEIVGSSHNYSFQFEWVWEMGKNSWQYVDTLLHSFRVLDH